MKAMRPGLLLPVHMVPVTKNNSLLMAITAGNIRLKDGQRKPYWLMNNTKLMC